MAEFNAPTLPPALATDPRFATLCALLWEQHANLPIEQVLLYLVETAPEAALPHLAEQFSLTDEAIWPAAKTLTSKRLLLKQAIELHRLKGTPWAVKALVNSFGANILLREWWQTAPPGPPHTFELVLNLTGQTGQPVSAAFVDAVIAAVHRVKPARSHFTFNLGLTAHAALHLAAGAIGASYRRLALTEALTEITHTLPLVPAARAVTSVRLALTETAP